MLDCVRSPACPDAGRPPTDVPKVHLLPLDVTIEAPDGATIMDAARSAGYYWPATCGGEARCTTCLCEVQEGVERLSPMGKNERRAIVAERGDGALARPLRLACQARVSGDVRIYKEGVRPPLGLGLRFARPAE